MEIGTYIEKSVDHELSQAERAVSRHVSREHDPVTRSSGIDGLPQGTIRVTQTIVRVGQLARGAFGQQR